jgi:hypothetical protein
VGQSFYYGGVFEPQRREERKDKIGKDKKQFMVRISIYILFLRVLRVFAVQYSTYSFHSKGGLRL